MFPSSTWKMFLKRTQAFIFLQQNCTQLNFSVMIKDLAVPWAAIPRAKTSHRSALRCRCGKPRRPNHVHLSRCLFSINLWYRSPSLGFAFHLSKQTGKSVGAGGAPRGRLASSESKFCLLLIWEAHSTFPSRGKSGQWQTPNFS